MPRYVSFIEAVLTVDCSQAVCRACSRAAGLVHDRLWTRPLGEGLVRWVGEVDTHQLSGPQGEP